MVIEKLNCKLYIKITQSFHNVFMSIVCIKYEFSYLNTLFFQNETTINFLLITEYSYSTELVYGY